MKRLESQLTFFLESIGSSPIKRIWRIFFEYKGEFGDEGPIELEFEDHTWLFDNESDGETLRISNHRWTDPFGIELTFENKRFVEECGKWSRVDVSRLEPYQWWVGEPVSKGLLLTNEFGTPAGVAISNRSSTFWFVVRGDECHVLFEKPDDFVVPAAGGWRLPIEHCVVGRCVIDHAFALEFHKGTEVMVVRIESDFVISEGGHEHRLMPSEPVGLGPAIGLFGQMVSSARALADGSLELEFEDGRTLTVSSDPNYEAWEFYGSDGLRIVCGPGGSVSVWQPKVDAPE